MPENTEDKIEVKPEEIKPEEVKPEEVKPEEVVSVNGEPAAPVDKAELNNAVVEALKSVYDPEIPVNIYELGLVYSVNIDDEANVDIEMTLTSPACPVAGSLPPEVEGKIRSIPGVKSCAVRVVWDPPWGMHLMSEEAKLQLNLY
ncbi:MAG: SUF system Fe-S cluster assembly protein [Ignavibacteria bacterium]|nr:SUF system Fe-S cluster assembly protein [Ignavibacteria bacterium]